MKYFYKALISDIKPQTFQRISENILNVPRITVHSFDQLYNFEISLIQEIFFPHKILI